MSSRRRRRAPSHRSAARASPATAASPPVATAATAAGAASAAGRRAGAPTGRGALATAGRTAGAAPGGLGLSGAGRFRGLIGSPPLGVGLGAGALVGLAGADGGKAALVAGVSGAALGKVKAGDVLGDVARQTNGKGGGRPDMAQGGGEDGPALLAALDNVPAWVRQKLQA